MPSSWRRRPLLDTLDVEPATQDVATTEAFFEVGDDVTGDGDLVGEWHNLRELLAVAVAQHGGAGGGVQVGVGGR